jgi:hypothetical protein
VNRRSDQQAPAALSVFRGGFDAAAADAVAGVSEDILEALVASGKVTREGERYRLAVEPLRPRTRA